MLQHHGGCGGHGFMRSGTMMLHRVAIVVVHQQNPEIVTVFHNFYSIAPPTAEPQ